MRITPNHLRLRVVAFACWAIGAWCAVQGGMFVINQPSIIVLAVSTKLLALLLLALGIAFWQLSADRRAGIVFDSKGLLLNLGHSSSFISWDNIESVGVSRHRASVFALGSKRLLGIRLKDVQPYIQSYEERLPASRGPLASVLRLIERVVRPFQRTSDEPLAARLANSRARTGYDVLIPEAFLGSTATAFVEVLDMYRQHPQGQRTLTRVLWGR